MMYVSLESVLSNIYYAPFYTKGQDANTILPRGQKIILKKMAIPLKKSENALDSAAEI